jgi:hypothetical protein
VRALTDELQTVKARALRLIHPNSAQTRTEREALSLSKEALSPSTVRAGEGGERQDDTGRRAREARLALGGAAAESDGHDVGRDAAVADTGTKVDLQQFMRDISAEHGVAWRLMPAAQPPGMPSHPPPPSSLASLSQSAGRSDSDVKEDDDSDPLSATNVSLGKIENASQQGAYDPVHELAEQVDRLVEKHQGHLHAEQHARELFLGSAHEAPRVPAVRAGRIKTASEIFIEERLGNVHVGASVVVHRGWGDVEARRRAAVEGDTHAKAMLTTSPRPPAPLQGRREGASNSGGEGFRPIAPEKHSAITRGYDSDAVDEYLAQNSRTAFSLNSQVSMLSGQHTQTAVRGWRIAAQLQGIIHPCWMMPQISVLTRN